MRNYSAINLQMKHFAGMALALILLVFSTQQALAQADLCANAGVVTCGAALTGQTNVGATNDAFPACNTSGILASGAPNVWYTFVGTGQTVTVSTCTNTNFDSEIGIFSGSCGALVCVVGNDNDACGTSDETVTFNSVAGTNYFIMVQGHASATGTFTLDVTCAAPPADPCAAPIETIACSSSKSVSLTGSGAGWNVTACGFSTPGAEKVYSFTPTVTGNHTLQVTATNGTFIDYFFKDASGGCGPTGWTCIDDISASPTSTSFGPLTAGTTYLILLDDESTTNSTATFQINCPAPPVDPCVAPIETIACASSKTATLSGSGAGWSVTNCGFSTPGAEKVYSFTPTVTGNHTLQVTAADGTFIDYFFKDASGGCGPTGWTCIDDISSVTSTTFGPLTAGTTYLILLDDESTVSSTHTFQINCPAPPDPCAAPIETIACASSKTVTLSGSGAGWNPVSCGFSTPGAEKVFSFTPTVTGNHTLQVTAADGTFIDYFFKAASGGCGATGWTCIDDISSATSTTFGPLTAGTTYLILLDDESTVSSTHTFQINCPAPPDPCAAPIETIACASSKTVTLSGTGAGWNPVSCGFSTPGAEKVFSFTPTVTGNHTLQVTAADGTFIDYFFKDASGGCGATGWTCIDDVNAAGSVTFGPLTAGTTYLILLDDESTVSSTHTFQINCPAAGPANDDCANATPIACGGTAIGSTVTATVDGPATNCVGLSVAPDVWYTIVGTGGNITASLCGSGYDTKIDVYTGTCGALVNIGGCNDDFCGNQSEMTWASTLGTVYRIRVHGFGGATGAYTLNVTCTSTFPTDGAATVACPALAVAPTPPTYTSPTFPGCGPITPTGPVIVITPSPLTCEGIMTYSYAYVNCELGLEGVWSFVYTIEREPFTVPANGSATVACPANATQPVPPVVLSNCGETISPSGPVIGATPACEGTKTYTWTYTDCEGNSLPWVFTYTIERNPFTVPANGAATVACPANATQPVPPVVLSNCGETITPTGPVIGAAPACEGTRTYTWTYTDCEGNSLPWTFTYTIERNTFSVPANGAATVACPANATQPVPPVVLSNCGETITPTGPVVTNVPNPLTCEGTRTYTWTYTDCEGNSLPWSFVYTIERQPFTVPANGAATVDCPADTDVQPTPPVVTSNCGEVLTPVLSVSAKPLCEGTRTYTFTYTDCEGNTADWKYVYTIEYEDFIIPVSIVGAVECPVNAFVPTPVSVNDNCGNPITPVGPTVTSTTNAQGCEASRKYEWIYTDCEGNSHAWSQTFLFEYNGDFFAPLDEENFVTCLAYAVPPVPQTLYDYCGQPISVKLVGVTQDLSSGGCSGWRKYSYVYTDCGGHSHPWNFTYHINDNEGPLGTCPSGSASGGSGGPVSVSVRNLECIEEVPCPNDYDFMPKVEELLEAGNYFDVCDGANVIVTLDSWSDLWECSDPDGDGVYTFGRTFYFRIADHCGNEYASLCEVTYSGECQPIETFRPSDWGMVGGLPGLDVSPSTTDLDVIGSLLNNNPLTVGGGNRSLKITDPQCIVDLLPGTGGPGLLANCHQEDCTAGCNPMGIGGMKNALAANAIAMTLNMRFNVQYNGLTMSGIRNQSLACINVHPCILACDANGACYMRIFDDLGREYSYPLTVGGLMDLTNNYLGGNVSMSVGQMVIYGTGINETVQSLIAYWDESQTATACVTGAGVSDEIGVEKLIPSAKPDPVKEASISLAPNPARSEVMVRMSELAEPQDIVIELYNSLGQQMMRRDFGKANYLNEKIDLSSFGNGLYIVSLKAGSERFEQKLIISKD